MMSNKGGVLLVLLIGLGLPVASRAAGGKAAPAKLTAAQIVQKHLAARGGPKAWHGVQSLAVNGELELGTGDSVARSQRYVSNALSKGKGPRTPPQAAEGQGNAQKQVQVPFVLEMKRPWKSRVQIEFAGKTAVQVWDGASGWLRRPYLNRDDWEPFSAEQAREQQRDRWELGGPLMDAAAQGTKVALVGVEPVDGRDAYELALTRKDGEVQHVWIDAKTFLDVKVEGAPRRMDGKLHAVWVLHSDFRTVQGLTIPFVRETVVEGYPQGHSIRLEKVAVNPTLDASTFEKPKA